MTGKTYWRYQPKIIFSQCSFGKDLKDLNSITFNNGANGANGKTVVNGEGMTINDAAGNPLTAVTKDGVKITDGPSTDERWHRCSW